jgi:predicted MarR family transcription regulator
MSRYSQKNRPVYSYISELGKLKLAKAASNTNYKYEMALILSFDSFRHLTVSCTSRTNSSGHML